MAVKTRTLYT